MMHPEQAAFEANIDKDPFDSTNHLVYADWLDEHDQPDEAAFRRSIGNWMQATPPAHARDIPDLDAAPVSWHTHPWAVYGTWTPPGGPGDFLHDLAKYPDGVRRFPFRWYQDDEDVPSSNPEVHHSLPENQLPAESWHGTWISGRDDGGPAAQGRFAWPSYRDMEKAFRWSFIHNRQKQYRRHLTRVATARGYVLS